MENETKDSDGEWWAELEEWAEDLYYNTVADHFQEMYDRWESRSRFTDCE